MAKHTSGPWLLEIGDACCFHQGNRVSITNDEGANSTTIAEVWPTDGDSDIADGRLIAAAPDLLAALTEMMRQYEGLLPDLDNCDAMILARAAIAKAEGRAPEKPARKFYRTTFSIDVLSEAPLGDALSLGLIEHAISEGPCVGGNMRSSEVVLSPKQAADALYELGSDPTFFELNDDGTGEAHQP